MAILNFFSSQNMVTLELFSPPPKKILCVPFALGFFVVVVLVVAEV
jgi:hypothetical protein